MKRILVIDDKLAMPGNAEVFRNEYEIPGFTYELRLLVRSNRLALRRILPAS